MKKQLFTAIFMLFAGLAICQKRTIIFPGELWLDSEGAHIQAHGGGIIKVKNTYYWYGEERRKDLNKNFRYVSCYASKDLVNWKHKGFAIKLSEPDSAGQGWVLERPKVYYNNHTKKYVMYFHLDGPGPRGPAGAYWMARVGTAISDFPEGPFKYLRSFRPLGLESRDIGQFIDDDGSAYLIFESRPTKGFYIARLSDDYLNVENVTSFIKAPLEGGAIVHYQGLYYVIGSALTGWAPNPNKYATAKSLEGPWSEFKDIAPPETKTYRSQSTMLLKVAGKKDTTVIFMGDRWEPREQWDSRYIWMPVKIGDGKLWLPEPKPFSIDTKTGSYHLLKE